MTALLTLLRTSRNAQVVALVIALALVAWLALHLHDNAVRKDDRAAQDAKAIEQAARAAKAADGAQNERNSAYDASRVDNASDVGDYLAKLRAKQCAANPAACRKTDVR